MTAVTLHRRKPDELSDAAIQRLIERGVQDAKLIDEMEEAVKSGDLNLVFQLAAALVGMEEAPRKN